MNITSNAVNATKIIRIRNRIPDHLTSPLFALNFLRLIATSHYMPLCFLGPLRWLLCTQSVIWNHTGNDDRLQYARINADRQRGARELLYEYVRGNILHVDCRNCGGVCSCVHQVQCQSRRARNASVRKGYLFYYNVFDNLVRRVRK